MSKAQPPAKARSTPRKTTRPTQPHAGQSPEPTFTRRGLFAHPGRLVMSFAAVCFFLYAFDVAGLQTTLSLSGSRLDSTVRDQSDVVVPWVLRNLKYFAMAVAAVIVPLMISILVQLRPRFAKKKRKPKAAAAPAPAKAAPLTFASAIPAPAPKPAAEFIRPARLTVRELDMKASPLLRRF